MRLSKEALKRKLAGFLVKQGSAAVRMRRSCLMLLLMMSLWMEGGSAELSSSPWHREGEGPRRGRGQGEARQRRRGQGGGPLISVERGEGPKHCDHHMIPRLLF
jgi:hypothetical protein